MIVNHFKATMNKNLAVHNFVLSDQDGVLASLRSRRKRGRGRGARTRNENRGLGARDEGTPATKTPIFSFLRQILIG